VGTETTTVGATAVTRTTSSASTTVAVLVMPIYYVRLNRPEVDAATPEEAMTKALTDPLGPNDVMSAKEVPPEGSIYYAPGGMTTLGGAYATPETIVVGPETKE
jgi:hypothetical protein